MSTQPFLSLEDSPEDNVQEINNRNNNNDNNINNVNTDIAVPQLSQTNPLNLRTLSEPDKATRHRSSKSPKASNNNQGSDGNVVNIVSTTNIADLPSSSPIDSTTLINLTDTSSSNINESKYMIDSDGNAKDDGFAANTLTSESSSHLKITVESESNRPKTPAIRAKSLNQPPLSRHGSIINTGNNRINRNMSMFNSALELNNNSNQAEDQPNDWTTIRCCRRVYSLRILFNNIIKYFQSYESHYVFLCFIAIIIGSVTYYAFPDVYGPWNNNLYKWPFTFLFFIICYEVAYLLELFVLFLLSFTIASFLWRFYFYLSCISDTFRKIFIVSVAIQFRKWNWFQLDNNIATYIDGLLIIAIVCLVLHVLRKMISKHYIWLQNQRNFSEKIEELFFIVDFVAILSDVNNYNPNLNSATLGPIPNRRRGSFSSIATIGFTPKGGPGGPNNNNNNNSNNNSNPNYHNPNIRAHPNLNVPGGAAFNELLLKVRNWTIAQTEAREILRSVKTARTAANDIFLHLDRENKGYITINDFKNYLPLEQACRAFFQCLPNEIKTEIINIEERNREKIGENNIIPEGYNVDQMKLKKAAVSEIIRTIGEDNLSERRIVKHDFVLALARFAEDRKKLSLKLTDWHSLSDVLVTLGNTIFIFVCFFVLLFAFGYNITTFLLPMTTLLVSFSFIFGNSVKTILEAYLFIFIVKAYSIGDIVELRSHTEQFEVTSIQLLSTTFRTHENKTVIIPNSVLGLTEITNLIRSKNPVFLIPIAFDIDTSATTLVSLKSTLQSYVTERPNIWQNKVGFRLLTTHEIKNADLKAELKIVHQSDFVNEQLARAHFVDFTHFLAQTMKKLGMRPK